MFSPTHLVSNPDDPCELPDLRWQRCQYLLAYRRAPSATYDDPTTHLAWHYFLALDHRRDDTDREQLSQRFPTVAEAHRIYTTAAPLRRAELEARLLADETDDAIARKLGHSPGGIGIYHELFFFVRPYLNAASYINSVVLGSKVHRDLRLEDSELLLKLFGYSHGVAGIDDYLDYLANPPVVPANLDTLDLSALKELVGKLHFKVGLLTLTTPASAMHPAEWQGLRESVEATQRIAGDQGSDAGSVLGSLRVTMDVLGTLSANANAAPVGDPAGRLDPQAELLVPKRELVVVPA